VIELIELTKHFGGIKAVDEVFLRLPKSNERIIGLIGPNGAGKTTLINLITGYLSPDKGKIIFDGHSIEHEPPEKRVIRGLVRTFQLVSVFNTLKVNENLALAVYRYRKLYDKTFNSNMFMKYPLSNRDIADEVYDIIELFKLSNVKSKRVSELPYGYKRILEIAMAYALKPKFLFLDEPFAGLSDPEIKKILEIIIDIVKENKIQYLFIVDHKVSWLQELVQRLIVMFEGRIIADGDTEEVIKDKKVIEVYWGREA